MTAHDPAPPHHPTAGGIFDLIYRDWTDADILPGDPDLPLQKQVEFGIGPGCSNSAVGQAVPPGRTLELCRALDVADDPNTAEDDSEVRCCIESVCDADIAPAFDCLAGMLSQRLTASP